MEQLHQTNVYVEGETGDVASDGVTLPEFETVIGYTEEAIHDGLDSNDVATYLERMGFDVGGYDPLTRRIDGSQYVNPNDARNLRLQYGRLLRRDVNDLVQN